MDYGLQLYSVRDAAAVDFKKAVRDVAKIGYKYVEFAGFFGLPAEEVKAILDECGLEVSGTHSPWQDLKPSKIMETIAYHKTIGNPRYIIPEADLSTLEKIEEFVNVMNFAQPILAAEGIKLGYHNHSHEFIVMPWGSTIHAELERRTNVEFEIDTFWVINFLPFLLTLSKIIMTKNKKNAPINHLTRPMVIGGISETRSCATNANPQSNAAINNSSIEIYLLCPIFYFVHL